MKKVLYVDMDNVLVDFNSAGPRLPGDTISKYEGHLDDVPGIFSLMDPVPGAVESYLEMAELFDTYILSTAPWDNPSAWADKLTWVKKYLGKPAHKRLILSSHKNLNIGHFLVDDRIKNGAGHFFGRLILFGSPEFPDWTAVTTFLRSQGH